MKRTMITFALLALTAGLVYAQEDRSWKKLESNILFGRPVPEFFHAMALSCPGLSEAAFK